MDEKTMTSRRRTPRPIHDYNLTPQQAKDRVAVLIDIIESVARIDVGQQPNGLLTVTAYLRGTDR